MRSKEEAHDYRYFPEPDLLDFSVPEDIIKKESSAAGELPLEKRERLLKDYGFAEKDIDVFIDNIKLADFVSVGQNKHILTQQHSS